MLRPPAVQPGGAPPPVVVGVVTVAQRDVGLITELPGRLGPRAWHKVRARAAGILQKRLFRGAAMCAQERRRCSRLTRRHIRRPYPRARRPAGAPGQNLAQATAAGPTASKAAGRGQRDQQAGLRECRRRPAFRADRRRRRQAAVTNANINLGYASVPRSRAASDALVTEGALVGQGEATQLAVVQQISPMYVNLRSPPPSDEAAQRRPRVNSSVRPAPAASVELVLGRRQPLRQTGQVLFSDLTVDSTTGQITLRAEVPKPDGQLLPGLYVRVRIRQAQANNAITVPQQAVTRNQGDSVMVVGADGKPARTPSRVARAQGQSMGRVGAACSPASRSWSTA